MTAARIGAAAGIFGAVSAAGAADWLSFVAFAVPAIGMTLYAVTDRASAR